MSPLDKVHAEQSLRHMADNINEMYARAKGYDAAFTSVFVRAHIELRLLANAMGCAVPAAPVRQTEAAE